MRRALHILLCLSLVVRPGFAADPEEQPLLSAKQLRALLLWNTPPQLPVKVRIEDLFRKLDKNPAHRAYYEKLISADPELSKLAQEGNQFRSLFTEHWERFFPSGSLQTGLVRDAPAAILGDFEKFLASQKATSLSPIDPEKAQRRALEQTTKKMASPLAPRKERSGRTWLFSMERALRKPSGSTIVDWAFGLGTARKN